MKEKRQKEFKKYPSLENHYQEGFIEIIRKEGYDLSETWLVQEKVHGANFCFIVEEGCEIKAQKRGSILLPDEKFYEWQDLLDSLRGKIEKAHEVVSRLLNGKGKVYLYGELCGGSYPSTDVTKNPSVSKIQKGVHYGPDHYFYLFDIKVERADGEELFLDFDSFKLVAEQAGFLYAKSLFKGALDECLERDSEIVSFIPGWLGLPPLRDNIIEGFVIKPSKDLWYKHNRIILKKKNSRFKEVQRERKKPKPRMELNASELFRSLEAEISRYVNVNRLESVLSKIGPFDVRELFKTSGLLAQDALEEFYKNFGDEFKKLEKEEVKLFKKRLNSFCLDFIKQEKMGSQDNSHLS